MLTEQPILITTIKIAETTSFPKHRFIGFTGYYGQPGQKSLGIVNAETNQNEYAPVVAKGIAIVSVGEAVSAGQALEAFDDGVAVPYSSGPIEGYAMDSAASAGQLIRILLA